jgi:hypothetical protein
MLKRCHANWQRFPPTPAKTGAAPFLSQLIENLKFTKTLLKPAGQKAASRRQNVPFSGRKNFPN